MHTSLILKSSLAFGTDNSRSLGVLLPDYIWQRFYIQFSLKHITLSWTAYITMPTSDGRHESKSRLSISCGLPRSKSASAAVSLWPNVAKYSWVSSCLANCSSSVSCTVSELGWKSSSAESWRWTHGDLLFCGPFSGTLRTCCGLFLGGGSWSSSSPRKVLFLHILFAGSGWSTDKAFTCLHSAILIAESTSFGSACLSVMVGDNDRIDKGVKKAPAQNSQYQSSSNIKSQLMPVNAIWLWWMYYLLV